MDELVRWLGEQLDEDERAAHAAVDELDGPLLGAEWRYDGQYVGTVRERTMVAVGSQDFMEPGIGAHIAAHDPARALRETDAKRRILAEHWLNGWVCDTCDNGEVGQVFPCPTLRLLALPYADRPGYQESWRP